MVPPLLCVREGEMSEVIWKPFFSFCRTLNAFARLFLSLLLSFFLLPHDGQEEAPAVEGGRCVFTGEEEIKQTSRPLLARGLRGGAGEMVGIHSIWTNSAIW